VTMLRQECGIGIVPVEVMRTSPLPFLRMTQGVPYFEETKLSRQVAAEMLGCAKSDLADSPIEIVSTGVRWLIIELSSLTAIAELKPNQTLITGKCRALKQLASPFSQSEAIRVRFVFDCVRLRLAKASMKIQCVALGTGPLLHSLPSISTQLRRVVVMLRNKELRLTEMVRYMLIGGAHIMAYFK
jgi:hypothetical protein